MTTSRKTQTQIQRKFKLIDTPEAQKLYKEALARWDERLKPLTDSIRRAQRITADDLNTRVGPCHD